MKRTALSTASPMHRGQWVMDMDPGALNATLTAAGPVAVLLK